MTESDIAYWQRLFVPLDGQSFDTRSELEAAITYALTEGEEAASWKGVSCSQALEIAQGAGWLSELGETVCVNIQPPKLPEDTRSRRSPLAD